MLDADRQDFTIKSQIREEKMLKVVSKPLKNIEHKLSVFAVFPTLAAI